MTATEAGPADQAHTGVPRGSRAPEQSRACYPDSTGYVERDGVRVFYELYGEGEPTVLFLPTWSITLARGRRRSRTSPVTDGC
jgi:hypothetical protein